MLPEYSEAHTWAGMSSLLDIDRVRDSWDYRARLCMWSKCHLVPALVSSLNTALSYSIFLAWPDCVEIV